MIWDEFRARLYRMAAAGTIRLPYDHVPEYDENTPVTAAWWGEVAWNPPANSAYTAPDPGASAKPSWRTVTAAITAADAEAARIERPRRLKAESRRRIVRAYGADSVNDEVFLRLRGGATEAQDAERDRIRSRYAVLKASLDTMTDAQIIAFDPTLDSHWAEASEDGP